MVVAGGRLGDNRPSLVQGQRPGRAGPQAQPASVTPGWIHLWDRQIDIGLPAQTMHQGRHLLEQLTPGAAAQSTTKVDFLTARPAQGSPRQALEGALISLLL